MPASAGASARASASGPSANARDRGCADLAASQQEIPRRLWEIKLVLVALLVLGLGMGRRLEAEEES